MQHTGIEKYSSVFLGMEYDHTLPTIQAVQKWYDAALGYFQASLTADMDCWGLLEACSAQKYSI